MPANAAGAVAASHCRAVRLLAGSLVAMPAIPAAGAATGASDAQRAGQKAAQIDGPNDGQKANSRRTGLKQAQAHSGALIDSASVLPSAASIWARSRSRGSKRRPGTSGLHRHHRASGM